MDLLIPLQPAPRRPITPSAAAMPFAFRSDFTGGLYVRKLRWQPLNYRYNGCLAVQPLQMAQLLPNLQSCFWALNADRRISVFG